MDPLEDTDYWDFLDYNIIDDNPSIDFLWPNQSASTGVDFSVGAVASEEKECTRKRGRSNSCSKPGSKACREKLRRGRLNDRFIDLSSVLEPGRPMKNDKPAILDDAIRVLNQLKTEAQELKETNEKLFRRNKKFEGREK
ncbi:Transcription factor protein [Quillaja saponaria]|uniref:Transcription factor protein n=1 Tax=Quillaja saponaria TaxID=32244 RepID=A0AAD7PH01_QUISA|nr:Transcription factor protein [Quillaja saponaria]